MRVVSTFLIFCFGFVAFLEGQITNLTVGFDKDTIEIGSQVRMTLSVKMESATSIVAVSGQFLDSIYSALQTFKSSTGDTSNLKPALADFDLMDMGGWDDKDDDGVFTSDEMIWQESRLGSSSLMEHSFVLRFWDPGEILLPLPLALYKFNGTIDQYYVRGMAKLFVAPPENIKNVSPDSLDMSPIKPILEEPRNIKDFLPYLIGIGLILAIVISYFWIKKRKNINRFIDETKIPKPIPADKVALEKLNNLQSDRLWQKGKIKEYQSRLTYIIREYLENRFHVAALESTTGEIVESLKNQTLTKEQVESLLEVLKVADLVKFAKAQPESNIHDEFMNKATHFVSETAIKPKDIAD